MSNLSMGKGLDSIWKVPMGKYHPGSDFSEQESVELIKEEIRSCLSMSDNINQTDLMGNTLLFRLLRCDTAVILHFLDFLLELGANVSYSNDQEENSLHFFLRHLKPLDREISIPAPPQPVLTRIAEVVRREKRIESSQFLKIPKNECAAARFQIIEVLIANLDKINQRNQDQQTPCMVAFHNKLKCTSFIAALGGGIDYQRKVDSFGMTPLHQATIHWDLPVVNALLESGATVDLKTQDKAGRTPLHTAAQQKKTDVMELLIRAGADSRTRDNQGRTARQIHPSSAGNWFNRFFGR